MAKRAAKPAEEMTPEKVLWAFFRDYRQLTRDLNREDRAADRAGRELDYGPFEARLRVILAAHCTPRPRPQSEALSWGTPEYDPKAEALVRIVYESPRRAVVYTKNSSMDEDRQFILLQQGGRWLLDSRKVRYGRKWDRVCL